jgi:sugar transferase EpsL
MNHLYLRWGKRTLDLVASTSALLICAPLITCVAVLVRVLHGSPILFQQQRPGLHGRPFKLLKIRTMTEARDGRGALLPDAQRLTTLGRFLRSTSLDELPELWNVLKGDMSLVGPRPLLSDYLPLYSVTQARRHEVRPGLTGWAQIHGRNAVEWEERFRLDLWYVENRSIWLDLRILGQTVMLVIRRKGITAEGEATMHRFEGAGQK